MSVATTESGCFFERDNYCIDGLDKGLPKSVTLNSPTNPFDVQRKVYGFFNHEQGTYSKLSHEHMEKTDFDNRA